MTHTHLDVADAKRRIKAIFVGSMGNLVEWYDFYAYTAFALYFAPAFFPSHDPVVQQLNAATLFAAGRAAAGRLAVRAYRGPARPAAVADGVGGHDVRGLADHRTHAHLRFHRPGRAGLLALARVIEGLSLGGEYGASATYLTEIADAEHRGFYSSFQYVTLIGGQLSAILVLLLLQNVFLTHQQLVDWGWRIPFVIGALLAIVTAFMRRDMPETDSYKAASKTQPRTSCCAAAEVPARGGHRGGPDGGTAAFYTFTTYMQTFVRQTAGFSDIVTTYVIAASLIFALILQPLYGALSDRIGAAGVLRRRGRAADRAHPARWRRRARPSSPADLRRLGLHGRLHLDQRRGEGRAVPDQHPRHRRGLPYAVSRSSAARRPPSPCGSSSRGMSNGSITTWPA